jgi:cell division protein ZapA
MSAKHSTRVTIFGEEYTLKSDTPPDHTRAVAAYVDKAIREVMGSAAVVESHKAAILACLSITDELFRERAGNVEMAEAMTGLSGELKRWLPPAKRSSGKFESE